MERKKIYMVKAEHAGRQFLRFVVCGMDAKPEDIEFAWTEIESQLTALLEEQSLAARKAGNVADLTQHFQIHLTTDNVEKSQ